MKRGRGRALLAGQLIELNLATDHHLVRQFSRGDQPTQM